MKNYRYDSNVISKKQSSMASWFLHFFGHELHNPDSKKENPNCGLNPSDNEE